MKTYYFWLFVLIDVFCRAWHQTSKFDQELLYETHQSSEYDLKNMKFFLWYRSFAVYGAREHLIFLEPNVTTSKIDKISFVWPLDLITMNECLEEWNSKEKCYNDIVHVRIDSNKSEMEVFASYAHRPMVRLFDLRSMSFLDETTARRDPHPPMDSDRSYVMLTFDQSIVTAGYQGDYIPTIRATQGKTLLYALRQSAYFIGGFQFDKKAVFAVIEPSDRSEHSRVSRLVMTCANRAEIIRKATLNCSTTNFDRSRPFAFEILTAIVEPIRSENQTILLFGTFTTDDGSITASAVCLFRFDRTEFYRIFTGPSKKNSRTNDFQSLVEFCPNSIPSTIDRDLVETEQEFLPYSSNPLIVETMSNDRFTALDVIQHRNQSFFMIIGTSHGRLRSIYLDKNFEILNHFEELTLPLNMHQTIKSINHRKIDQKNYVIVITNSMGYLTLKFEQCANEKDKFCFQCWTSDDCSIRKLNVPIQTIEEPCTLDKNDHVISTTINQTDLLITNPKSDDTSRGKLFLYIIIPLSTVVCFLSIFVLVLLKKYAYRGKTHCINPPTEPKTRTDPRIYCTDRTRSFVEKKSIRNSFPNQSDLCIRRINSNPVYSTASSQSLPSLVISSASSITTSNKIQTLSANQLYRSYV